MEKIKEYLRKYVYLVVIAVALLIAGTNYLIYPMFIKKNMNIVKVPVAVEKISGATRIEETMITEMEIIDGFLPENVVTDKDKLNGLYVKKGAMVPSNGFFYSDCLSNEEQTLGTMFSNLNENEYAYNLSCKSRWVENDNIRVGQYINVYFVFNYLNSQVYLPDENAKATPVQNVDIKNVFGQLAENVRVLALSSDKTTITLALTEEQIAQINLAEQFLESTRINNQNMGEIIPMIYFNSNMTQDHNTEYYDIDKTINWIMSKSEIIKKELQIDDMQIQNDIIAPENTVKE